MLLSAERTTDDIFVSNVTKIDAEAGIERIHFLDETAIYVFENGDLLLQSPGGEARTVTLFDGALLSSAASSSVLIASDDSGNIVELQVHGAHKIILIDEKRRWIDQLAVADDGSIAWAIGKQVFLRGIDGASREIEIPSSAGGLAFSADYLGIAHYNGITLCSRDGSTTQKSLGFEGMHTGISFHPDGDFVVTRMRDPALHGWCLKEGGEHVMEGYPRSVRSVSWSAGGQWLASSGARYLALWPIRQPQNPISKVPFLLAGYRAESTAVACHPDLQLVAVGYADGAVLLIRIQDEAEILLKNPSGSQVRAVEWSRCGKQLAVGCADGTGRLISFQ